MKKHQSRLLHLFVLAFITFNGFSQTKTITLNVVQPPSEQCLGTGLYQPAPGRLTISPNPSNGIFTVSMGSLKVDGTLTMKIFSLTGKLLYTAEEYPGRIPFYKTLNVNSLAKGIYLLKICGDNIEVNQRIVIL